MMDPQMLQMLMGGAGGGQGAHMMPDGSMMNGAPMQASGGVPPEGLGAGAGGSMDPRMAQLKRQQRMADMLRQQAVSGQNRGPGAAPILQQLMSGALAGKMDRDSDSMVGQMGREQAGARAQNLDQLIMALRRQIPGSNQPMLPPEGMEDR